MLPAYRVRLRPIRLDDVDSIMEWINDPSVTGHFAGLSQAISRDQELAFLRGVLASDTDRLFAIEDHDGRYLGNVGIHKIYWPAKNGRLGVVIGRQEAQGRGLGTEALHLVCRRGFETLGLHKLWLVHYATNHRMAHVAHTLGFRQEGVLRDEYFHHGAYHDMVRHSLLEGELRPLTGSAAPGSRAG